MSLSRIDYDIYSHATLSSKLNYPAHRHLLCGCAAPHPALRNAGAEQLRNHIASSIDADKDDASQLRTLL